MCQVAFLWKAICDTIQTSQRGDFLVCQVAALIPGISYDGGHAACQTFSRQSGDGIHRLQAEAKTRASGARGTRRASMESRKFEWYNFE